MVSSLFLCVCYLNIRLFAVYFLLGSLPIPRSTQKRAHNLPEKTLNPYHCEEKCCKLQFCIMRLTDCKEEQALAVSPDAGIVPDAHIPLLTGHRCTQALLFLSCSLWGKETKVHRLARLHCAQGEPNFVPRQTVVFP